jgi:hypothetical protein
MVVSVVAREMDEDVAILPAEYEPGVAFVGNATLGFDGDIRVRQCILDAVELGKLVIGPIALTRKAAKQRCYVTHTLPAL